MAATELLDYNQIQEQSSSTGDKPPSSGGLLTWNFRCDPNLAWDPSQSWFAMDVQLSQIDSTLTDAGITTYNPEPGDLRPFFPLRMFSSMTHIIDGVTVAHTNQPYADKLIQEKYLKENTQSNLSNFEAQSTARLIDSHDPSMNPWVGNGNYLVGKPGVDYQQLAAGVFIKRLIEPTTQSNSPGYVQGATHRQLIRQGRPTHTILFQPPFDMWTKHQRCSGGNHQIQLVMKPGVSKTLWGSYISTPCFDQFSRLEQLGLPAAGALSTADYSGGFVNLGVAGGAAAAAVFDTAGNNAWNKFQLVADVPRIRLLRRMVRFTVERPLSVQEFNLTEMQFYHGTASKTGVTQNFLLPSSTFGLVFYWRQATNPDYDVVGDFPSVKLDLTKLSPGATTLQLNGANAAANAVQIASNETDFFLDQFYFTYGGETYPSQRISQIGSAPLNDADPHGFEKLQTISHQLQGVYNMPMENMNMRFGVGESLLTRLNDKMFFFPVAKHNNSDNSDLQVYWSQPAAAQGVVQEERALVVCALYDARVELAYNAANQLERVTKTEWK